MIKGATEQKLPRRLVLLYSNRAMASTAFLSDLERWTRMDPRFRLIATVTGPVPMQTIAPGCAIRAFLNPDFFKMWAYETGIIDAAFLLKHLRKTDNAVFYVAGPEDFLKGMLDVLAALGTDLDSIRSEEFAGY